MERMFLNPENGEIRPESHYLNENIDLDCLIEKIDSGDGTMGFIIPEANIDRYRVRCDKVYMIFKVTTFKMLQDAVSSTDKEEIKRIRRVLVKIADAMLRNMREQEEEEAAEKDGLH